MPKRDFYEVLGIVRTTSADEIKKSFRRLAMKYHPDRNHAEGHDTEEQFKEIKAAYDVLSDGAKRQIYDRFGHEGLSANSANNSAGAGFADVFGDIFSSIFSGGSTSRSQAGASLRYPLEITLLEAVHGADKEIEIPNAVVCQECSGSGARKGSTPKTCSDCRGSGQLLMQQGLFRIQQTCGRCQGAGIINEPCKTCRGQGQVQVYKKINIKIPAGIDTGDRIRITGAGEPGDRGQPAGDLYIDISLIKHPLFEREGNDLHCDIPVSFNTCVLGGNVEVRTLKGVEKIKVPPETQPGKIVRLPGKGVKSVRSNVTGDLYCRIWIDIPVNLTAAQKALLRQFDDSIKPEYSEHFSPRKVVWLESIKNFFSPH